MTPEPIEAQVVEERTVAALSPAVVQHTSALVVPAAAEEQIVEAFLGYQNLKDRLLNDGDYQTIAGKRFPKKSAWRKLGVAFGVSFSIKEKVYERDERGRIIRAEITATATAPNGRHSDGLGACDLFERCCQSGCRKSGNHRHCPGAKDEPCNAATHFSNAQHDLPATAETRAKNRAASDLFGFGEVSAEEMNVHRDEGWWGGWASEAEFAETTKAVFDAVKNAPDEVKARCREWKAVRGIEGSRFSKDDFGEFSEFVESLLTQEEAFRPKTPPPPPDETGELPAPATMKADLDLWVGTMTEGQKAAFGAWCRMVELPEDASTWTDDHVTDAYLHVKAQTS